MTNRPNTRAKSKITGDQFAEFAATRRSTRDFLPTPIPQDVLDEILRDAMTAASWSNTKPILVAVASGEKRDRLSAEFMNHWHAVQAARSGGWWPKLRLLITRYSPKRVRAGEMLSYSVYRWECAIRASVVMGFVGAGGIGQDLIEAIRKFYYSDVSAILVLIIITVALIDLVTERIKRLKEMLR